ncbi:hypothetical protein DASC09_060650 [Saccharomycopsis crataegensis]|uniref:Uncharacterized protein n=1 Tax=Saccharomycopsis crataegensis TaxID=43959 RepID=A0AAV5QVJ3_9ASCO|nr:hypothetical protein DASC09_060650 [Saccharomycopsis crataegensis]
MSNNKSKRSSSLFKRSSLKIFGSVFSDAPTPSSHQTPVSSPKKSTPSSNSKPVSTIVKKQEHSQKAKLPTIPQETTATLSSSSNLSSNHTESHHPEVTSNELHPAKAKPRRKPPPPTNTNDIEGFYFHEAKHPQETNATGQNSADPSPPISSSKPLTNDHLSPEQGPYSLYKTRSNGSYFDDAGKSTDKLDELLNENHMKLRAEHERLDQQLLLLSPKNREMERHESLKRRSHLFDSDSDGDEIAPTHNDFTVVHEQEEDEEGDHHHGLEIMNNTIIGGDSDVGVENPTHYEVEGVSNYDSAPVGGYLDELHTTYPNNYEVPDQTNSYSSADFAGNYPQDSLFVPPGFQGAGRSRGPSVGQYSMGQYSTADTVREMTSTISRPTNEDTIEHPSSLNQPIFNMGSEDEDGFGYPSDDDSELMGDGRANQYYDESVMNNRAEENNSIPPLLNHIPTLKSDDSYDDTGSANFQASERFDQYHDGEDHQGEELSFTARSPLYSPYGSDGYDNNKPRKMVVANNVTDDDSNSESISEVDATPPQKTAIDYDDGDGHSTMDHIDFPESTKYLQDQQFANTPGGGINESAGYNQANYNPEATTNNDDGAPWGFFGVPTDSREGSMLSGPTPDDQGSTFNYQVPRGPVPVEIRNTKLMNVGQSQQLRGPSHRMSNPHLPNSVYDDKVSPFDSTIANGGGTVGPGVAAVIKNSKQPGQGEKSSYVEAIRNQTMCANTTVIRKWKLPIAIRPAKKSSSSSSSATNTVGAGGISSAMINRRSGQPGGSTHRASGFISGFSKDIKHVSLQPRLLATGDDDDAVVSTNNDSITRVSLDGNTTMFRQSVATTPAGAGKLSDSDDEDIFAEFKEDIDAVKAVQEEEQKKARQYNDGSILGDEDSDGSVVAPDYTDVGVVSPGSPSMVNRYESINSVGTVGGSAGYHNRGGGLFIANPDSDSD